MEFEKGMKMLIVSSYPPRECGIATFSNDIVNAVENVFGNTLPIEVCALQNNAQQVDYNDEVTYVLTTTSLDDYRLVAEKINDRNDIGLVCVQHEFGLFGGEFGDYILSFILALNKPVITVFHSVLPEPEEKRKKVVHAIADLSNQIVVLTKISREILVDHYNCPISKITVIPHGTHTILWEQKENLKTKYNLSDKIVLSTFGLINENKNIETVLYALPEIVAKYPQTQYLVIGKTHPEVIKREGENYRDQLIKIVQELQLENNVVFINEYLELWQLLEYLTLSEIYLFSSKDPNQAVSGTFAYAMSCGCAVISTPIPHAVESLTDGNGILLDNFDKPKEFEKAILKLIKNKEARITMGKNAFSLAHATSWENIAIQYRLLFDQLTNREGDLRFNSPPIKLDHIEKLTTDFGILQFSKLSEPDPESGYTLDDNARALIDMVIYHTHYHDSKSLKLADTYMEYIEGIQKDDGWFYNYKSFDHQLTKQNLEVNLEDANGRALWSLGTVIANKETLPMWLVLRAEKCWNKAIERIHDITSPRAIAYALKGLFHYYSKYPNEEIKNHIEKLANELLRHYHINSEENWCWYEDYMTYANNVLPEAMLYSYMVTRKPKYKKIALITFDFLLSQYFMKGQLKVISNRGWFKKQNERVFYGEQPIEVSTTIIALDLFYEVTGNSKYKDQLKLAFNWFLGNNHLKQIMYNPENGASYDGLEDKHVNINQGAESTLCFFKAQLIMEKYAEKQKFKKTYAHS
ncbi:glycosyltransferase [Flavobacterium psychrotolerans]|uniref:Glycosyl transferase family 1 n=1 Tax=Flavobacterium psychrotolerans TaxID=2169410 RepID=A0A2U1JIT9_9FLAO|nr:glycosyltransferase [Flavobacterium psychrotolerans]PWA05051.1 glycosyl transferase family 1 [Flavobacterium psychrotolerans]